MRLKRMQSIFFAVMFLTGPLVCAQQAPAKPVTIQAYEDAWRTADSEARLTQIKTFWADDSTYVDPAASVQGAVALNKMIDDFRKMFPGAILESDAPLAMNNSYTWNWRIFTAQRDLVVAGRDYAVLDQNGRISKLVGFWEPKSSEYGNRKVVASYFDSLFKTRDMKTLASLLSADATYFQAVGLPYGGTFVGFENWVKMYQHAGSLYDLRIGQEPVYSVGDNKNSVTIHFSIECTSKKTGKSISMPISEQFELKAGKIASIRPFYFDTKAFAAFLDA